VFPVKKLLQRLSPADDPEQDNHDGNYQKHVNETANGVGSDQSQQPQDEKNDSNGVQHDKYPLSGLRKPDVGQSSDSYLS
jgi:hypothetical protein